MTMFPLMVQKALLALFLEQFTALLKFTHLLMFMPRKLYLFMWALLQYMYLFTHVAIAKTSTWLACCADACWQTSACWQAKDMGLLPDGYGVAFRDCNCRLSDKQIKLTGPVTNMWLFLYWFGELLMEALRLLQTWLHKWLFGWCLVH